MTDSEIQRQVEQHLAWCNELAFDDETERTSPDEWEPFGPYCGCDTCVVREVMMAYLEITADKAEE